jgi:tetratricopeptide (TPR) repeat protein
MQYKRGHFYLMTLLLLVITSLPLMATDLKGTYVDLLVRGEYEELSQHLAKWEEIAPDDPELYIAYFNYHFNLSRQEGMIIGMDPPEDEEVIALKDPETGEIAGYVYNEIYYDEDHMGLALEYLDEGLKRHPDRLDMHLGKIHTLGLVSRYEEQKDALIAVLDISYQNGNNWLWQDGERLADGFSNILENTQSRLYQYFQLKDENGYDYIIAVSEKIIELYPEVAYSYNNIAAVHYHRRDYQEAIKYFKLAEEKAPYDTIVISNIAYLSKVTGDIETALEYYEKLKLYGNEEEKDFAGEQIRTLSAE